MMIIPTKWVRNSSPSGPYVQKFSKISWPDFFSQTEMLAATGMAIQIMIIIIIKIVIIT